ncbi:MAG: hypothetical protein ACRD93_02830 [Nitrososphaeraceae archaeon]
MNQRGQPQIPYFINLEFFASNKKQKELDIPERLFIVPPPSSKIDSPARNVWSNAIDDFCLNDFNSISIRTSKISGTLTYDAVFYPGNLF